MKFAGKPNWQSYSNLAEASGALVSTVVQNFGRFVGAERGQKCGTVKNFDLDFLPNLLTPNAKIEWSYRGLWSLTFILIWAS